MEQVTVEGLEELDPGTEAGPGWGWSCVWGREGKAGRRKKNRDELQDRAGHELPGKEIQGESFLLVKDEIPAWSGREKLMD